MVDALPVPERDAEYGARVWRRIEAQVAGSPSGWRRAFHLGRFPWRWAVAGTALAGLLVAAFLAGRYYPLSRRAAPVAEADSQARESVLLVAVGDYLERSQMVLIELANADPKTALDISAEQERAHGLVSETRIYQEVKRAIVNSLASQNDVKQLVAVARTEKDPETVRYIVSRLAGMKSPEASDYLMEILKK